MDYSRYYLNQFAPKMLVEYTSQFINLNWLFYYFLYLNNIISIIFLTFQTHRLFAQFYFLVQKITL